MKAYSFNINITAKQEAEANEKMKSLVVLASKLTVKELSKLAHIIQHDPVKMALAKQYLGV